MGFHELERTVWEKERKEQTSKGGRRGVHTMSPGSGKELSHAVTGARSSGQESMSVSASPPLRACQHYSQSPTQGSYDRCVRRTEPPCRMLCASYCVARGKMNNGKYEASHSLVPANVYSGNMPYGVILCIVLTFAQHNSNSPIQCQWQAIVVHTHTCGKVLMTLNDTQ